MNAGKGKQHILAEAKAGRLDPQAAEELSLEMGWGALRIDPDPAAYEPWNSSDWTFGQAVAWLAWGSRDALLVTDPHYAHDYLVWRPVPARHTTNLERLAGVKPSQGWELIPSVAPPVMFLIDRESRGQLPWPSLSLPRMSISDAASAMMALMADGDIEASALNWNTLSREKLAPLDWSTSGIGDGRDALGRYIDVIYRRDLRPAFYDIYVDMRELANRASERASLIIEQATSRRQSHPPTVDLSSDQRRIWEAVKAEWPDGIPEMRVADRDNAVNRRLTPRPASERALRTFFNVLLPQLQI